MHIHILGICGTFMGSLALLAKAQGHRVTGSDRNVYPPMSTQLAEAGIELIEGFNPDQLTLKPDLIVVGNIVSRGNPVMEAVLNQGLKYCSGPQWLKENVLQGRWVLAVSGTHGKTSTSSMLAWILDYAGMKPGFLIGGVPGNFAQSARLGDSDFFVIEADEYDTAFFDKRSKFVHYLARTLVINNLEYDHADIFPDLAAIQRQFHYLVRTVPSEGLIIFPQHDNNVQALLAQGSWSELQRLGLDWRIISDADEQQVYYSDEKKPRGKFSWELSGKHNQMNALAAIAAARHVGVDTALACEALSHFEGVKRRMELIADIEGTKIYDDFAHHPTAINTTLEGLRNKNENEPILAIIELRSNTMEAGVHKDLLVSAASVADEVCWFQKDSSHWSMQEVVAQSKQKNHSVYSNVESLLDYLLKRNKKFREHIVIMSNGGFEGLHKRLVDGLKA